MNFLTFESETSSIVFAKDFWIFIASAVPLTIATLGVWFLATHQEKKGKGKKTKYITIEIDEEALETC